RKHGGGKQDGSNCGRMGDRPHWLISRDHEIALTYMPSGLARRRSASRGVWITMVRIAVQRSVVESWPFSKWRSVHATRKLSGDARMTEDTSTAICWRPTLAKGSLARA